MAKDTKVSQYLTPNDIAKQVDALVQEEDTQTNMIYFINQTINKINLDCGTIFPLVGADDWNNEYTAIQAPYNSLIVDYVCYLIKRANEDLPYADWLNEYNDMLVQFKSYGIDDKWRDPNASGNIVPTNYEHSFWNNHGKKSANELIDDQWQEMKDSK